MVQSSEKSNFINWLDSIHVTQAQANAANLERAGLLESLANLGAHFDCAGKKLYTGKLSPGCRNCMEGTWSCLFLNSFCTADCFFCPQIHLPETTPHAHQIAFPDQGTYLEFLALHHIKGVSFSGGEPLLSVDSLLSWIAAVRERLGDDVYIWLYTNGDLLDRGNLDALQQAGLDEVRINLSAREYSLAPVEIAREGIRTVTVEVPAIPEDYQRMSACLHDLEIIGVDHLNLHQLYANQVNYESLAGRGYRFLSPEFPAPVWDSEITALRLLNDAVEQGLSLPVHYCSLDYQSQTQGTAVRRMANQWVMKPIDEVTQVGYIRRLFLEADPGESQALACSLAVREDIRDRWQYDTVMRQVAIHSSLLSLPEIKSQKITIQYLEAEFIPAHYPLMDVYQSVEDLPIDTGIPVQAGCWQAAEIKGISPRGLGAFLAGEPAPAWVEQLGPYEETPSGFAAIVPGNGFTRQTL